MFSFIFLLVMTAVSFILSEVLRPKPPLQNANLAHLGDFQFPTATQGRVVPIIWGTVQLSGPNVIWYGNLKPVAITQKIKTGMFSSTTQTTGYLYHVGMQMGLCRGQIDSISKIWIGQWIAWQGFVQDGLINIKQPHLFGGIVSGYGGVSGNLRVYSGTAAQTPDPYLATAAQNYLWFDDFSQGISQQGVHRYLNSDPGLYYWVGNNGTGNNFGPATTLFSDAAEVLITATGTVNGTADHLYNKEANLVAPGDLNVYTATLQHPDRVRLVDKIKIFMTFKPMTAAVRLPGTPTSNVFLGMGCRCQDLPPFTDGYGIFVTVNDQSNIVVWVNSPTSGGIQQVVSLSSPGSFAQLGNNTQTIELDVSGATLTLILNNVKIWSGSSGYIASIPGDHQGFNLIYSGNCNTNFNNIGADWTYVGIYNFGIDQLGRPVTASAPGYRGFCHAVWEGGYLGTSTQIQPWAFEASRCPNGLGLAGGMHQVNQADANPMNVLYEILTDPDWGLGFQSSDIDLTNFTANATTLFNEGNGWSAILDSTKQAEDVIKLVTQQIDGVLYIDRSTGLWTVKLARFDYTLGSCPVLNETNLLEIKSFTRGAWAETTNNLRVAITNRDNDYQADYGIAQDSANILLQGGAVVTTEEQYPGVKNKTLANQIAWRDLRMLAYPIAKAQVTTDRSLAGINPGFVISWSDASLGISNMAMRISRIDLGKLEEGIVTIDMVQDVFGYMVPSYADPQLTAWLPPQSVIPKDVAVTDRFIMEAPNAMCRIAEVFPGVTNRLWCGGRYPGDQSTRFEMWTADGANAYADSGGVEQYLTAATLASTLDASGTQGSYSITVTASPDVSTDITAAYANASVGDIGTKLFNIVAVDNEFMAFTTIVDNNNGTVTLGGGYRGLMDTVPAAHANGARLWFLSGNLTSNAYGATDSVAVKLLTEGIGGVLDIGIAQPTTVVLNNRAVRPYPPVNFAANGAAYPTGSVGIDTGLSLGWTRRDWRTTNEVTAAVDETSLPSDFPAANTTQYQVQIYNDPNGLDNLVYTSSWSSTGSSSIGFVNLVGKVYTAAPVPPSPTLVVGYTFNAGGNANLPADFTVRYDNAATTNVGTVAEANGIIQTALGLAQCNPAGVNADSITAYNSGHLVPPGRRKISASVQSNAFESKDVLIYDRLDYTGNTGSGIVLLLRPSQVGSPATSNSLFVSLNVISSHAVLSTPLSYTFSLPASDPFTTSVEIHVDDSTNVYEVLINGTSIGTATISNFSGTGCIGFGGSRIWNDGVDQTGVFSLSLYDATGTGYGPGVPTYIFPSRLRASILTQHTVGGVVWASEQNLTWDFNVSSTVSSYFNWGLLAVSTASPAYTAAATGTFTLTLSTALSTGVVEASVNGGAYATVIAAGATSGTLAVTSGQTVIVQHTQVGSSGSYSSLTLTDPSSVGAAFGILSF